MFRIRKNLFNKHISFIHVYIIELFPLIAFWNNKCALLFFPFGKMCLRKRESKSKWGTDIERGRQRDREKGRWNISYYMYIKINVKRRENYKQMHS